MTTCTNLSIINTQQVGFFNSIYFFLRIVYDIFMDKLSEPTYQEFKPRYTNINYNLCEKFNISVHEYCVLDSIYQLSTSPMNKKEMGWCYATNQSIGEWIRLSASSVSKIITRLTQLNLIEVKPQTNNQLRKTTDLWNIEYLKLIKNINPQVSKNCEPSTTKVSKNCEPRLAKIASHNNIYNNNKKYIYKYIYTKEKFLEDFNRITGRGFKLIAGKTLRQFNSLAKIATREEILKAIINANSDGRLTGRDISSGKNYLTPEYITRADKFEFYLNLSVKPVNEKKWEEFLDMIRDFTKLPVEATEIAKFQFQKLWDAGYKDQDFERVYDKMWKDPFMKKNFTNLDFITRFNTFISFI